MSSLVKADVLAATEIRDEVSCVTAKSMSMSVSILDLYNAISNAYHLYCAEYTIVPREWSTLWFLTRDESRRSWQSAHAVRQAVSSRPTDPQQRRPDGGLCFVDTAVQIGWTSMSAGDVGDRSAAIDQVPRSFVLQTEYPTDVDNCCHEEFVQFLNFLIDVNIDRQTTTMMKHLLPNRLSSCFSNVITALRLFLTLLVADYEGERERPFSRLAEQLKCV